MSREVAQPWRIDAGRTARVDTEAHVKSLIEAVLFTSPGERVNRPSFGSGLLRAVFAPNSDELVATLQVLAQASLEEWLDDLIEVESVQVEPVDARLEVTVQYVLRGNRQRQTVQFVREV
jgi:phage baseplate assembly protein W